MDKPGYWSVVPAEVRYSKQVSSSAKLLYGEISALCNMSGYCWATDEYFSDLYECGERSVRRWIKELCDAGFIVSEISQKSKQRRKLMLNFSNLVPVAKNGQTGGQKWPEPVAKNGHPYKENNKNNNNKKKYIKKRSFEMDFEDFWKEYGNVGNKKQAESAWDKINTDATKEDLIKSIRAYKEHLLANPWKKQRHASTWLNQEGWLDSYQDGHRQIEEQMTQDLKVVNKEVEAAIPDERWRWVRERFIGRHGAAVFNAWLRDVRLGVVGDDFVELLFEDKWTADQVDRNYREDLCEWWLVHLPNLKKIKFQLSVEK